MDLEGKTVVFRADGSHGRGIGHLMRCLAFADGVCAAGAKAVLASTNPPSGIVDQFDARGSAVLLLVGDAEKDADTLKSLNADWIVVDSYDIDAGARAKLALAAKHMAIIDDAYDNGPYHADLVINPNPGASARRYGGSSKLAIGSDYLLIRQDIVSARRQRSFASTDKICISCGGSDPMSAAQRALMLLEDVRGQQLTIRVVIGPMAKGAEAIRTLAAASYHAITLADPSHPIEDHLNWADFAILAAGTIQWEAAYLGCPFVSLIVADNQAAGALAFAKEGGSVALDWRAGHSGDAFRAAVTDFITNTISIKQMSEVARTLIDGQGARRLAALMAQIV